MAASTRITTTPRPEINALAYQGIIPTDCYPQITATLVRQLGPQYAALLAEPVPNRNEGFIDWYTEAEGQVQRFSALDPIAREAATQKIVELAEGIRALGDSLIATNDPQKVTRGNLLKLALNYPNNEHIFLVGEQPVVVCWGFAPGEMDAQAVNLCDLALKPKDLPPKEEPKIEPQIPPPAPKVVKSSFSFLPWLWPLLLLLLLLALLLTDWDGSAILKDKTLFTVHDLWKIPACEQVEELKADIRKLQEKLVLAERELQKHIAQCSPKPLTIKETPPKIAEKPKEELYIPDNVKDTSFMHGRWICDTGLINSQTHEPVQVEFVFDAKGHGSGTVYEKNDRCTGKAEATFEKNILHIQHDNLVCQQTKGQYIKNKIDCKKNEFGKTECAGVNADGTSWDATFYKITD